jgi:hypothetical protein
MPRHEGWWVGPGLGGACAPGEPCSLVLPGLAVPGLRHPAERCSCLHTSPALQAMTPPQCWLRQCRNLLHIYREQSEFGRVKAVALLMAAAAPEGSGTRPAWGGGPSTRPMPCSSCGKSSMNGMAC